MSRILAEQFDLLSNLPDPLAFNPNVEFKTTMNWQPGTGEPIGGLGDQESAHRMGTLSAESESGQVEFPVKQRLFMLGGADQPSRWNIGDQPAHSVDFDAISELQDTPPIDPSTGYAPVGPDWSDTSPSNPHIAKVRTPTLGLTVLPEGPSSHLSIYAFPTHEDYPDDGLGGNKPGMRWPDSIGLPYQLGGRLVEGEEHHPGVRSWREDSSNLEGQGDFETFPSEIAKHYAYYQAEQDKFRRRVFGTP